MGADNQLYGGTINDFADSMAEEIEFAYNAVLAENGKEPLPTANPEDRRMLFVAIARGVINHLQKKRKAITVKLPVNPSGQTVTPEISKR
ncbi:MAG: hypothetical protein KIT09_34470 [Bryobacteraceae bacterium]|nr:hypothetical protein [Bryobacteraceae bacterium]